MLRSPPGRRCGLHDQCLVALVSVRPGSVLVHRGFVLHAPTGHADEDEKRAVPDGSHRSPSVGRRARAMPGSRNSAPLEGGWSPRTRTAAAARCGRRPRIWHWLAPRSSRIPSAQAAMIPRPRRWQSRAAAHSMLRTLPAKRALKAGPLPGASTKTVVNCCLST